jgi:hypothetical protein
MRILSQSRLRSAPIIQARTRTQDLPLWWQGMGFRGRPPRAALLVDNRYWRSRPPSLERAPFSSHEMTM